MRSVAVVPIILVGFLLLIAVLASILSDVNSYKDKESFYFAKTVADWYDKEKNISYQIDHNFTVCYNEHYSGYDRTFSDPPLLC
ncbi:hypothetical protein DRN75_01995 [Nanoarchaeota archaeon]|nr:MAG: hypothetical protein DRN75_01995 [Nanoarchaeota archaeon]